MNDIVLFSNGCPRCKILKQKLDDKQIKSTISNDFDEVMDQGLQTAPVLKVNNKYYQFGDAVKLIGELI